MVTLSPNDISKSLRAALFVGILSVIGLRDLPLVFAQSFPAQAPAPLILRSNLEPHARFHTGRPASGSAHQVRPDCPDGHVFTPRLRR